jgi:hypothetical protein
MSYKEFWVSHNSFHINNRCRDRMVVGFTNMQSVHITTKVVSSKPVHGDLYSIQYYVIKFVSEILLKVLLNTTTVMLLEADSLRFSPVTVLSLPAIFQ